MRENGGNIPEGDDGKAKKVGFFKLFSFADGKDIGLMAVGTFGAVANGLCQPLMLLIFGQLINSFGSSDASQVIGSVSKIAIKLVYLAIGAGIVSFLQVSTWMVTGERQAARIRSLYLKTILRQEVGFFDTETTTGEVVGRMSGDTVLIQDAMGEKVGKFLQLMSTFVGGFVVAFTRGWLLTLVLVGACTPLLAATARTMTLIQSKMSSRGQVAYAEAGNVVEQAVGSIRTVAAFTGEKHAMEKYKTKLEIAYRAAVKQGAASGFGLGTVLLVLFCCYGLAIWLGSKLIIERGYNGGEVITILVTIMAGGMSLGQSAPCVNAFAAGQAAAFKMFETIKRVPKIDSSDKPGTVLDGFEGNIELRDVYFAYPARPDVQVFAGFSLQVPSGTTTALVGQSGSGKSTVISLIERFYDPDSGEVLIDGVNLKNLKLSWIRNQIGLVGQEPVLFATSIKENIAYGKENATEREIRTATELANAAKFIDKLPEGLNTMVGEHGTQLSGGQKQRIAIARAILKNPKILLLDEATSALDAESEKIVQDALTNVMSNRTTVIVAHRLTTIRGADMIAVVQRGLIVEKGSHDELIKDPEGPYNQLVRLQEVSAESDESQAGDGDTFEIQSDSQRQSLAIGMPSFEQFEEAGRQQQEPDVKAKEKPKSASIRRLASLNKTEWPVLLVGCIAAIINGLIFPIFGLLLASAIRMFYKPPHELRKQSKVWAGIYVGLGIINFVVLPMQNYLFGVAGGKLIKRIRSITFERVLHQDISWFDDPANSSGAVGARLSTDASNVRSLVGDPLGLICQNISTVVAGLFIAFYANWILALVILFVSPLMLIQGYYGSKFMKGFSADANVMYEEASQVANDAVGSIRTVASFSAEKKVMAMYQSKCEGPVKNGVKLGIVSGIGFGSSYFVLYCVNALIFYIGSLLINHGIANFGEIFKVFFAITTAGLGVAQSSGFVQDFGRARESAASIFATIDRVPKINSSSEEGVVLESVSGEIKVQNVSFKYPLRPDIQIFRDLSLTIPSRKTVALVGESGSGKSTVISLIERFYSPDSGSVYLDDIDIKKLNLKWLRQQMGLVSQEPALFNETIRTNIAYGKMGEVTEEEIIAATKAANAHSFISTLPHGYDTNVGERGVQLSGGQKQRIAIARAILKNPRILLLDEATSALDAESERVVQEALDEVMINRTSIVVAHRLTTIRGADIIAVVRDGIISEEGSHDELMKIENGAYASLVALQTSH